MREIEMRAIGIIRNSSLMAACLFAFAAAGLGQTNPPTLKSGKTAAAAESSAHKTIPLPAPTVDGEQAPDPDVPEAETILPYYNNYLKEYRLGPSDMISVEVFGQCPDYCKTGITVPPNARISYPLIREGILVAGKTVEQVAAEITKKLDEFIIDPKVTVTLDKAVATRYAVMGNVATPGVRIMDRKVSVYEAILESGGVTKTGDRNKVYVVSYGKDQRLTRKVVSLSLMESGKAEMVYLSPGDQVFVAGKGFSIEKIFDVLGKASTRRGCCSVLRSKSMNKLRNSLVLLVLLCGFQTAKADWVKQNTNTFAWFHDIFFVNESKGWIVGGDGMMLTTTNGGQTWVQTPKFTTDAFVQVYFTSETTGWLLCERNIYARGANASSYLRKTTDGGRTWEQHRVSSRRTRTCHKAAV